MPTPCLAYWPTKPRKDNMSKEKKQPKTIKVRTVVTSVVITVSLIVSFILGAFYNQANAEAIDNQVKAEVTSQVELLKQSKK